MKRFLDFLLSFCMLLLLSPLILISGILIYYKIGSPIIFKQKRPGYNGKSFYLYKFRSMTIEYNSSGELLPDEARLTSFGKFLRKFSLDELPQLWNVLKGDMSFVGPRPLLMEYMPLYSDYQMQRHKVKPGITGWAQVNGRNAISWQEKFKYDIWYVENQSFSLDLKILFLTVMKVFRTEGISQEGQATMKKFEGNESEQ